MREVSSYLPSQRIIWKGTPYDECMITNFLGSIYCVYKEQDALHGTEKWLLSINYLEYKNFGSWWQAKQAAESLIHKENAKCKSNISTAKLLSGTVTSGFLGMSGLVPV